MGVSLHTVGTVAVITLDEPSTRNALSGQVARALLECFDEAQRKKDVAALVVRGAGGHFCSGAHRALLSEARQRPYDTTVAQDLTMIYESFVRLANMPIPTVAAVRGAAVGAGLNLALAADVRIVSRTARAMSGFLRIGVHPGGGHFTLIERTAGSQAAVAMTLLGEQISGERMAELGIAWEAVDDDDVDSRALALAAQVTDPKLARDAVESFRGQSQSGRLSLRTAVRAEQALQFLSLARQVPQNQ